MSLSQVWWMALFSAFGCCCCSAKGPCLLAKKENRFSFLFGFGGFRTATKLFESGARFSLVFMGLFGVGYAILLTSLHESHIGSGWVWLWKHVAFCLRILKPLKATWKTG